MTVLLVVLALAALYLLCGLVGLFLTCGRENRGKDYISPLLRQPPYLPYRDLTQKCKQALFEENMTPLRVVSYDGKLLGGRLWECENAKGTVLLFHGYHSCGESDFSVSAPVLHQLGYNLLLVDQRAHRSSQGCFLTFGAKERLDVISWVTYIGQLFTQQHPIFLMGISMGASTVLMASEYEFAENVRGILADCGYTTPGAIIRRVAAQKHVPKFILPAFWLCAKLFAGFDPDGCSAAEAVKKANYPILFVHGEDDHLVPCEMGKENYAACRSKKELILVPGAAHGLSYLVDRARVEQAIAQFLQKHLA